MLNIIIVLSSFLVFQNQALAKVIDRCGTYEIQGTYFQIENPRTSEQQTVIVTDEGTDSQVTFHILPSKMSEVLAIRLSFLLSSFNYEFQLRISSSCEYDCYAEIVSVKPKHLENARSFIEHNPAPLAGTEKPCR